MDAELIYISLVLFGTFIILLAIGISISISILLASIITLFFELPTDMVLYTGSQKMFSGIDSFGLLAAPFFIFSGNLMNKGGIARRLVNLALLIGGKIPGSLLHANVISNMLFGSVCGSSVAAASAVGGFMGPLQREKNYDPRICAAVNIASAPTGLLIPPTGMFIIYSLMTGASVATLFIAAYIPGILMGLAVMIYAYFVAKKYNYPTEETKNCKEAIRVVIESIPSLAMIIIVIGGIVAGIFTATEGGAIAVAYALILSLAYKTIKVKDILPIAIESAYVSGTILFLIAASGVMSWAMAFLSIPESISEILINMSDNKYVIFIIMNIILLFVGTFMDVAPALLIFTPIFFPIAVSLGMDPIHFGVMIAFNLCVGNFTPPVGSALFVGCSVAKVSIDEVLRPLLPIFLLVCVALFLVTYIPWFSLFLPRLFGLI
ncbi:TRAP transporter large permease [Testudinibacter sp. P80/BLE/0925]|uniref:TRAP transporter large permease n=1 Tax=Testudinibacter sp. TW-1 TaxID=3417757 RepID=UPI003D36BC18